MRATQLATPKTATGPGAASRTSRARQRAVRGRSRGVAGLTLVEVLVAMLVLAVVLVAVGGLLTGNLGLRRSSTVSNTAVQLATSYLEAIKREWSLPDSYTAAPGQALGALPDVPDDPRYAPFDVELSVSCLLADGSSVACLTEPDVDLRELTVRVTDRAGKTVAELTTWVGRPFAPARRL